MFTQEEKNTRHTQLYSRSHATLTAQITPMIINTVTFTQTTPVNRSHEQHPSKTKQKWLKLAARALDLPPVVLAILLGQRIKPIKGAVFFFVFSFFFWSFF